MRVGIGVTKGKDARTAGREVATQAMLGGTIARGSFALAFCGGDLCPQEFLAGIHEVIDGSVPVVGGSGIGIITNTFLCYANRPAGMILIEDDGLQVQTAAAGGLDRDEHQTGLDLAGQLAIEEEDIMLLFFDTVRKPGGAEPPVMNSSIPLLAGIEQRTGVQVPIFGGGTIRDYLFSATSQFCGNQVLSQSAIALVLRSGTMAVDCAIMHGCSPKDGIYHTITKIDGAVVYELDHRPVVEVINEMYGDEQWQQQVPLKRLALGVNVRERLWENYVEGDYINRLIVGILPDKSGIVLFESDFTLGSEVLFMLRDSRLMIESALINTEKLITRVKQQGKKPAWGLYIDCAGRSALFSQTLAEEAAEVQDLFNEEEIPLFGFFSGVEIAPLHGRSRGLDWTGVLMLFSDLS